MVHTASATKGLYYAAMGLTLWQERPVQQDALWLGSLQSSCLFLIEQNQPLGDECTQLLKNIAKATVQDEHPCPEFECSIQSLETEVFQQTLLQDTLQKQHQVLLVMGHVACSFVQQQYSDVRNIGQIDLLCVSHHPKQLLEMPELKRDVWREICRWQASKGHTKNH